MKTNNSNLSFKSRIVFVSPSKMANIFDDLTINKNAQNISNWNIRQYNSEKYHENIESWCGWRKNAKDVVSLGIRSCSAGVVVKKNKTAALAWHIEDTYTNLKDINILKPSLKGKNAILIGSKSFFHYSKKLFKQFKNIAQNNNVKTTYFQGLAHKWEAHMAYNGDKDTLFLCVNNIEKPCKYVHSQETLKRAFEKIKISDNDTIEFKKTFSDYLVNFKKHKIKKVIRFIKKCNE